jgi:ribosomal protein S18 acetylase RimI-like enzyme
VTYQKAQIRAYRAADESHLFTVARSAFGEGEAWSDGRTLAVLERDTVFVAELAGRPAGYVAVEHADDAVRILHLLVDPVHEGEGVGHQLIDYAEGFAIAERARRLEVVVESDNVRAHDFYRRRGFTPGASDDLLELVLPFE